MIDFVYLIVMFFGSDPIGVLPDALSTFATARECQRMVAIIEAQPRTARGPVKAYCVMKKKERRA
jgi:hypothetical protein